VYTTAGIDYEPVKETMTISAYSTSVSFNVSMLKHDNLEAKSFKINMRGIGTFCVSSGEDMIINIESVMFDEGFTVDKRTQG